jgi:hypothetical protein
VGVPKKTENRISLDLGHSKMTILAARALKAVFLSLWALQMQGVHSSRCSGWSAGSMSPLYTYSALSLVSTGREHSGPVRDVVSEGASALMHGTTTTPLAEFNAQCENVCARWRLKPILELFSLLKDPNSEPQAPAEVAEHLDFLASTLIHQGN